MTSLKEVKSGNYLVLSLDLLQQSLSCYLNSDSVYYFLFGYMWCCVCQCALCDFMHVYELPADSVWCCSHGCNSAWEFFWLFFHHHLARRFHHWKTCSKQVLQSCMSPMSSLPQLFPTWVLTGTFQLQEMTKLVAWQEVLPWDQQKLGTTVHHCQQPNKQRKWEKKET